ncbi:MAG: TerB family tellurite resistance protein [Rhizobiaceae bacterium]|nr:TerB family tellurite resistance protein [Rhizobiaceae bacterium]
MLERMMAFLKDLPLSGASGASRDDDPRVAAAALLYHVMNADGIRQDVEWDRIKVLLAEQYGLEQAELDRLVAAGEKADAEAIDLYTFTSVLKRHLDEQQRIHFVRMLWDVVYADGEVHELEDNTLWRIAELIGVDRRDRITARQEAAEQRAATRRTLEDE